MEDTQTLIERQGVINPTHDIKLFAGRSNTKLAYEIADYLGTTVGPMTIKNFADGEIYVQVDESLCVYCGTCYTICPDMVFEIQE